MQGYGLCDVCYIFESQLILVIGAYNSYMECRYRLDLDEIQPFKFKGFGV